MTVQGVYKWLASGKIEGQQIEDRRYVLRTSVRKHVGAELYGATLTGHSVATLLPVWDRVRKARTEPARRKAAAVLVPRRATAS